MPVKQSFRGIDHDCSIFDIHSTNDICDRRNHHFTSAGLHYVNIMGRIPDDVSYDAEHLLLEIVDEHSDNVVNEKLTGRQPFPRRLFDK